MNQYIAGMLVGFLTPAVAALLRRAYRRLRPPAPPPEVPTTTTRPQEIPEGDPGPFTHVCFNIYSEPYASMERLKSALGETEPNVVTMYALQVLENARMVHVHDQALVIVDKHGKPLRRFPLPFK